MAHLVWRRGGNKVYLYYYDSKAGKLVQVPRAQTKHWDGLPPDEVYALKRQWEEANGQDRDRVHRIVLANTDKLAQLWASYQKNRMQFKRRRVDTAGQESHIFECYICPFFLKLHQKKDPTQWHALVPDFHSWLFEQVMSDSYRRKILWALERFGKFLVFSRVMSFPFTIQTPTRDNHKETPLKVRLAPEEILKVVETHQFKRPHKKQANPPRVSRINYKLAVLLGYFASLRPEELYALEKADFFTGERAEKYSKTLDGFREYNIGSKLAVKINKTLKNTGVEFHVKTHYSYGYVTIWHPEAAKAISNIVKELPDGRLFPFSRGYLDKAWREIVFPLIEATAHDLRRASGLYLGRTLRVPLTLLQDHMRHAEIDTTVLYTRAPAIEEDDKEVDTQDFNDVV